MLKNKQIDSERPWGGFTRFTLNEQSTVKILDVKPNSKLSLQFHNNRKEFWFVLGGEGKVQIKDDILDAKKGDEFFIKTGDKHRIMTQDSELKILEISFGEFDEDDIVRVEDEYGRN